MRAIPDIDWITPIAWKLAQRGRQVLLLTVNPRFTIHSDYRLRFLQSQANVTVRGPDMLDKALEAPWAAAAAAGENRLFPHDLDLRGVSEALARLAPATLSIDMDAYDKAPLAPLVDAARARGVPVLSYPQGNRLMRAEPGVFKAPFADALLLPHQVETGNVSDRPGEYILGGPRYCAEWMALNLRLLEEAYPRTRLPAATGRLKTLILGRPLRDFYPDHVRCAQLRALPFTHVLFKGKPRGDAMDQGDFPDWPTLALIRWADVVVASVTSVLLDAFLLGKPVLYLREVAPKDEPLFLDYGLSHVVEATDDINTIMQELHAALRDRHADFAESAPASRSDAGGVARLIRDLVQCGDARRDVLIDYARLYDTLSERHSGRRHTLPTHGGAGA